MLDCIAVFGQGHDQSKEVPARSPGAPSQRGSLARFVFGLDGWLRRRAGVIEYSTNPNCIFRIEPRRLDHAIMLSNGSTLRPGEEIVQLHFWTERVPQYDGAGATFEWARRFNRVFHFSLRELALFLARGKMQSVRGVRASVALGTAEHMDQVLRFSSHYGFTPVCDTAPVTAWSHVHRFGENILISLLILAHNRRAFRLDCLRRSRADVFLTRAELDERFGPGGQRTR